MALMLILQLLTLWPLCHTGITSTGTLGPRLPIDSVPPASLRKSRPFKTWQSLYSLSPTSSPKPRPPNDSVSPDSSPKPLLGAQPATIVTPGINVTLTCWAPQPTWRFALFKSGESAPVLYQDVFIEPAAEFFLEEVTEAQGGSYHCCYRNLWWAPSVWSPPSNALELLVIDELPLPSLVALPGPVVDPGDTVSLRCSGGLGNMSFVLYRVGEAAPVLFLKSEQPWADFPLPRARAPGTYTCYYHTPTSPYVLSQRSQPLVISLDGSPLDYTRGNLVRLGLAGLVLILLATLVILDWRSWHRVPPSARP